jgi:ribonucleoside-diphosphate reductase alpha chain
MSEKEFFVKKRNGKLEKFNPDKINKILQWATEGIKNVSFDEVAMNVHLSMFDGITSKDIHTSVIEAAAGLISEEKTNYQYVAGRLLNYQLRKSVWGGKNAPKFYDFIKRNIDANLYDKQILTWFTKEEIDKLDEYLKHDRDLDFPYAGIKQLCDKYLVQNRLTKEIYETPQFVYMLIAMVLFKDYEGKRVEYIKRAYNYFSKHKINLPTPIMAGVRTTTRSFASCALFDIDDNLNSIFANTTAIGKATAARYGIGFNFGRLRAINTPIRNGEVVHTGVIPFLKVYESIVKSCQQIGVRGGSATAHCPWWHYEIEDVLVLKNNAGTDDNRVRKLDYSIGLDKVFYERFIKDKTVTLFSPHEVPELYNAFGLPNFKEVYEKCEKNPKIKYKKVVNAKDIMLLLARERYETARIYVMNVDHANDHSPWKEQVTASNLCQEIIHPLKAIQSLEDPDAEIGVCILSGLNVLEIKDDEEFESVADVIVRMLDSLIDYQDYFVPAAANFAKKRRSLGVGITNLAALLAKDGIKYDDKKAPNYAAKLMEKISYYLIKASVELSKEKGPCEKFSSTKYSDGILPIDNYKKDIDEFVTERLHMDWEKLRKDIKKYGMRHSTLTALMPVESSSVIQSATNGIEPPRSLISYKRSKAGVNVVVVPHLDKWKDNYTLAFGMKSNEGILKIVAALQKFVDMSISTNVYYNTERYPDKKPPQSELIGDILNAYKWGLKNLYYSNTSDGDKHTALETTEQVKVLSEEDINTELNSCAGGACAL